MMTLEKAKQTVADLKDQLAAAEQHKVELEDQRDLHAFGAFTGDASAKLHLAKATKALIEHDQHVLALQAALRTANQHLAEAQGIAKGELERQKAEAALKLGRAAFEAVRIADKGMRDAFAALHDAYLAVNELNLLGCPPTPGLFAVNVKRAIIAASAGSRFQIQPLAPGDRHSLSALADAWHKAVEHWAAQRLDPKQEKAA
jgi:hypothetical protein